jgi:hypothetical protein
MELTIEIPDDLARSLTMGNDLSRRVVEALAAEEYRSGHLTKPQLRKVLGFETSNEIDGFLKKHHVWIDYDEQELEKEQTGLDRLGV